MKSIAVSVRPLTPELWPALEDLFGPRGAVNDCWCMGWRIGAAYRRRTGKENKADFRAIVRRGPPPGLLAFSGDLAVGWCQVTPRSEVPALDRHPRLKPVDDLPVWSITCFYVRKGWRKRGITYALVEAALRAARRAKAPALEVYPLDRRYTPSATSTGVVSQFRKLGFETVARRLPARPIMRRALR
jgi:GNAT superfamily N-acetyltransferase